MKFRNHLALSLISLPALLCAPLSALAQAQHRPAAHPVAGAQNGSAPDPYLDQVVATVEARNITRRDVARLFLDYNPQALTATAQFADIPGGKAAGTNLPDLAPKIFGDRADNARDVASKRSWDTPASTEELRRLAERIFAERPAGFDDVISLNMQMAALQVAAERRHMAVSETEIATAVHAALEQIRVSRELPAVPGMTDRALARKLGTSYNLQRRTAQTRLLKRNLILADLNDRLGHTVQSEDFYRAHIILLTVDFKTPLSPETDWARTQRQAEAIRADILAKKQTYEEAATRYSDDPSARAGGDVGPLVRSLLPATLEQALQRLQPGEIAPPIRTKNRIVLLRLDKRGSDLTSSERQRALDFCCASPTRERNALARQLKTIQWHTAVGEPPEWFRTAAAN